MRHPLRALLLLFALFLIVNARQDRLNCTTRSNVTIVESVLAARPDSGSASELITHLREPWPLEVRHGHFRRVVRYCYSNPVTRGHIDCNVQEALGRWRDKLDSARFAGTTNLQFEELHNGHHDDPNRTPHYCFIVDENGNFVSGPDRRAQWNFAHVPADTLWIQVLSSLGEGADTNVGYIPSNDPRAFGRHLMRLGPHASVDSIMHEGSEFGHIFGMIHEVARSDRDNYINYQCSNVDNYATALAAVRRDNPSWSRFEAHTELCEDVELADHYGFLGAEYVKQPGTEEQGGFDIDSIQLYTSTDNMDRVECFADPGACPISAWARSSNGQPDRNDPTRHILRNTHPSDGDARCIQRWYPAVWDWSPALGVEGRVW